MGKLLMVDDSKSIGFLVSRMLEDYGIECKALQSPMDLFSGSGPSATLVEYDPDMILLDIVMPGMTGLEALKRLKTHEALEDVPIAMLSSASSKQNVLEAIEAGARGFITKPFNKEKLVPEMIKNAKFSKGHRIARSLVGLTNKARTTSPESSLNLGVANLNDMWAMLCKDSELLKSWVTSLVEKIPLHVQNVGKSMVSKNHLEAALGSYYLEQCALNVKAPLVAEGAKRLEKHIQARENENSRKLYKILASDVEHLTVQLQAWLDKN